MSGDGRNRAVSGYDDGYWMYPTILDDVPPASEIAHTEIFGPVLSLMHASTMDEALQIAISAPLAIGVHLHQQRRGGAQFRSEAMWQYWHQYRRGGSMPSSLHSAGMTFFVICTPRDVLRGVLYADQSHRERWPREWSRQF